jgi:YD repeat-containing protein
MSNPSYFSQSSNFISAVQGGVDPRTGLYTFNLPLAKLQGDNLAGPALALTLNYSPLSTANIGFGIGVGLSLSTYDASIHRLSLASGEQYCTDSNHKPMQTKLKNFTFAKSGNGYQLVTKSGQTEHLSLQHDGVYVVDTITSPDGRALHIQWDKSNTARGPVAITDDAGASLLTVEYVGNMASTRVTVWPGKETSYEWTLSFKNGYLTSVSSNGSDPALTWTLGYEHPGNDKAIYAMTSLLGPTGLKEKATYYADKMHWMQFPTGAPATLLASPLPCVNRLTISPGQGQPDMVTQYRYTQKNYLGKDGGFGHKWDARSDFALGHLQEDYQYGSTAEQMDSDGSTALVTTTRRYNNYHLLLSEETSQGNGSDQRTHLKVTDYYAVPGDDFDAQPAQYQCPKTVTETWTDASKPAGQQTRQEIQTCTFDAFGNPTSHTDDDGTVTAWEYYPAEGGDGCPADPNDFVRYAKKQTVTPPQIAGDEPVKTTVSTWQKLPALNGAAGYAVLAETSTVTCGPVKQVTTYAWGTDQGDALQYGRPVRKTLARTPDVASPDTTYTATEDYQYATVDAGLTQTTTLTAHDGLSVTASKTHDVMTGKVLSQTDAQNNTVNYVRDKLERLTSRTLNPGTDYENTLSYAYSLADNSCAVTDVNGNTTTQYRDPLERKTRTTLTPAGLSEVELSRQSYNVLGQVSTATESDPQATGGTLSTMTSTLTWDNWGQATQTARSDNTTFLHVHDPVTLESTHQELGGEQKSGSQVTRYDAKLKVPVSETLLDASGSELGHSTHEYDGLKRLRKTTDIMGNVTAYAYDAEGRVLKTTLPDGSCVAKAYAPHTSHALPVSIAVTPKDGAERVQGTQTFDGLGRLTQSTCGGRTSTYQYDPSQLHPKTVTGPDGKTLDYRYIPQLGNSLQQAAAAGIEQNFEYKKVTGQLLKGKLADETHLSLAYNLLGQLTTETRHTGGTARQATYGYTLRSTPVSYTDVTGAAQTFGYDDHGRFILCEDPDIRVDMTYDALGRLHTRKTASKHDDDAVTLTLTYDDFHRETSRVLTDNNGAVVMQLDSEWYAGGQLKQQTRSDAGGVLSTVTCRYDGRSRLTDWTCEGAMLPKDAYGQPLSRQQFTFDALNNLTQCVSTFEDQSADTATYRFDNADDPTQLTAVTHTHASRPASIALKYDVNGRMVQDESGRLLGYDGMGRLSAVNDADGKALCSYAYDPMDVLCGQQVEGQDKTAYELYYRGHDLVCEILPDSQENRRFMRINGQSLGMTTTTP